MFSLLLSSFLTFSQASQAEKLADAQLKAYNERNLDAFMKVFAKDIKIYDDLSKYNVTNREAMETNYKMWFNSVSYLKCEVIDRISAGDTVIDYEKVTYQKHGEAQQEMHAIAIYRISGNKITEVSFIRPKY
ncbi:MAG: SnoaL-like domain-containing protein [Saprospiraceae bacterium]|nr:SnoaL-like domain-containing protein [Saprospiraceae bacterium]